MTQKIFRRPLARLTLLTLAAASTLAFADEPELVRIDNTTAAANALVTTDEAAGAALRPLDALTRDPRLLVIRSLNLLAANTTPAAVAAARRGVNIACPLGGGILATLPKSGRRVLRLSWNACAYLDFNQRSSVTGQGEMQLPTASFTPDYVWSLHLGTLGEDLVVARINEAFPENHSDLLINLHVDGRLPLTRFLGTGIFTGAYDVTIDGKMDSHNWSAGVAGEPDSGYDSVYLQHADDLRLVGSATHSESNTVLDERVTIRHGSFRQIGTGTRTVPFYPESTWSTITGADFSVRRVLRVLDRTSTVWIDGDLYQHRNPFFTCGDGWYSFRTLVPIRQYNVFGADGKDSGTVVVNGATITYALTDGPAGPSWYKPQPGERPVKATVDMGAAGKLDVVSYFVSSSASELGLCAP